MAPGAGDRSGAGGKGSAPNGSTPTPRHLGSYPAPEPGPALGKLEGGGRRRRSRERDREKEAGACPCSLLQLTSATGTGEAGWSGELGSRGAGEPTGLMSIKAKACASVAESVCGQANLVRERAPWHTCSESKVRYRSQENPRCSHPEEGAVLLWVGRVLAGLQTGRGVLGEEGREQRKLGRVQGGCREGEQVPNLDRSVGPGPMPPITEATVEFTFPGDPWPP